jgi:predicted dienelactone hydrolase
MRTLVPLLFLAACRGKAPETGDGLDDTGAAAGPEDLARSLPNRGRYGVGYTETSVATEDPAGGGTRTLRLAVWYPSTLDTVGAEVRYQGVFVGPDVAAEAPRADGPFPLAVFSHGHQAYAEASGFTATHLASHGWLVLAPDHTGNTTADGDSRTTPIYYQRPHDISAVIDHAVAGGDADGDAVVVFGHSFGGYTTLALAGGTYDEAVIAACLDGSDTSAYCSTMTEAEADVLRAGFSDDRVDAWVAMAPGDYRLFGPDGLGDLSAPVLLMTGDADDRVGGDAAPYWAALRGEEDRWARFVDARHNDFVDLFALQDDGPSPGAVRGYLLAFARLHALGDETVRPVVDGELLLWEEGLTYAP